MTGGPVGVGIVGAGVISQQYLSSLAQAPDVRVAAIADLDASRAQAQAARHGIRAAATVAELLADPAVELVVNLTIPAAHADVGRQALATGLHVWSEKPLALSREDGHGLLALADRAGLRLGCAPDTLLAPGAQLTQRLVGDGAIGRPVSALVVVQNPGPDRWHPNPDFLFARGAGPLFDLGPYYLQALVQHLGPVVRVTATASTARPVRTVGSGPRAGERFAVEVPTHVSALLETRDGATAVVVASFESEIERSVFEITGSDGAIAAPQPTEFDGGPVLHRPGRRPETPAPGGRPLGRGVGVVELARAIRAGAPPRADAALAFHVLDVMLTIEQSAAERRPLEVASTCESPALLPDGWDPRARTL